jgi:hypothetical protein
MLQSACSQPVIEQAKGILMARHCCGPDRAFRLLAEASQRVNRKLRDVAALVSPPSRRHRATWPTGRAEHATHNPTRSLIPGPHSPAQQGKRHGCVARPPSRPFEAGHLLRPEPLRAAAGSHLLQQEAAHDRSGGEQAFPCHPPTPPRRCCLGSAAGRPTAVFSLPTTSTHDRSPPSTVLRQQV